MSTPSLSPPQDEGEKRTTLALRLPSAVAGILTIMLVAWWMWEWMRSRWAAMLAGIIVATSPAIFEHAFRTGEMDGVLTLFVTAALYCWWRGTRKNDEGRMSHDESTLPHSSFVLRPSSLPWLASAGAMVGLAVMTKSAAGLLPLPIIALHWLLCANRSHPTPPKKSNETIVPILHDRVKLVRLLFRGTSHIPFRALLWSSLLFIVIVAPWHIAMSVLHGTAFWNEYLGFHVVRRITEQLHNEGAGSLWYIGALRRVFTPWVWLLIPATLTACVAWWRRRDHALALLLSWLAVTFIGFSAAQTKFAWYLLPLLPAAALLIAWCAHATIITLLHKKAIIPILHGREELVCNAFWVLLPILAALIGTVGVAGSRTYVRLAQAHPKPPWPAIAAELQTQHADGLVAYGFRWEEQPAAYFIMRTALPQVKLSDGLSDPARAREKLAERDRAWLIVKTITELPKELRDAVVVPIQIGGWSLAPRAGL